MDQCHLHQERNRNLGSQAALGQAFPNASVIDIQNTSEKVLGFFKPSLLHLKWGHYLVFFIGGCLFLLLGKLYIDIRKESYNMLFLDWDVTTKHP